MVATHSQWWQLRETYSFSPLFIAAMVATVGAHNQTFPKVTFQSAFHRGNGCYSHMGGAFSPLFIAAMVATSHMPVNGVFQSAFHRGNGCYYGRCQDFSSRHSVNGG